MPVECECDWSIMHPENEISDYQRTLWIGFGARLCLICSCRIGKKKYSGAIYITEEADIQGRTIDTIFCEDNVIDSWC